MCASSCTPKRIPTLVGTSVCVLLVVHQNNTSWFAYMSTHTHTYIHKHTPHTQTHEHNINLCTCPHTIAVIHVQTCVAHLWLLPIPCTLVQCSDEYTTVVCHRTGHTSCPRRGFGFYFFECICANLHGPDLPQSN